jgi:hypothetical protein
MVEQCDLFRLDHRANLRHKAALRIFLARFRYRGADGLHGIDHRGFGARDAEFVNAGDPVHERRLIGFVNLNKISARHFRGRDFVLGSARHAGCTRNEHT